MNIIINNNSNSYNFNNNTIDVIEVYLEDQLQFVSLQ